MTALKIKNIMWNHGEDEIIAELCRDMLVKMEEMGFNSIALPAIGTGIQNYPKELFAETLFSTILAYFS